MALVCPPVRRTFSDERGPGTFHSLGPLPMRKSNHKPPVFHIHDDDEHSSSLDEHVASQTLPFPRSTSPQSSSRSSSSPPATPPPPLSRGVSTPILLSNGKPLKSSLKSSSSSPAMLAPAHHLHLRARSEPSTPATTPKNVHFPEKDYALATVRIFSCKARPAALSSPNGNGNGDETETEGEDPPSARFPFPRMPSIINYEVDPAKSSVIPSTPAPDANLLLESLYLPSSSPTTKPLLVGSLLVRNLAFEKHVAVRFTLDDWQTVSEVGAHYVDSFSSPPHHLSAHVSPFRDPIPSRGKGWDRFAFAIRLEDYAPSLSTRTMWLAAHYRVTSTYPQPGSTECGPGGEWWDNNGDKNYRVAFRPAAVSATPPKNRPRHETISASITSLRTQPQLPTTCKKHALGLMIPSLKEMKPLHENHKPSVPPRIGKLSLCNYVPPKAHTSSTVSFPSTGSPQSTSTSLDTQPELAASATCRLSSDEESTSPASSTLSTPTVSPTIPPRVIIGGQPATYSDSCNEKEDDVLRSSRPLHVADWEWSAPSEPRMERLVPRRADLMPPPDALSSSRRGLDDPLYDAFVTQWCFAQGPSPIHSNYGEGGILV